MKLRRFGIGLGVALAALFVSVQCLIWWLNGGSAQGPELRLSVTGLSLSPALVFAGLDGRQSAPIRRLLSWNSVSAPPGQYGYHGSLELRQLTLDGHTLKLGDSINLFPASVPHEKASSGPISEVSVMHGGMASVFTYLRGDLTQIRVLRLPSVKHSR